MPNNNTFCKITNEDIYREIKALHKNFEIINRKVAVSSYTAATALTIALTAIVLRLV